MPMPPLTLGSQKSTGKKITIVLRDWKNRNKRRVLNTNHGANAAHWFGINADRKRHRGDIRLVADIL